MTSSTWSFESRFTLWRNGVDAENISRFTSLLANPGNPLTLAFTDREVTRARAHVDSAAVLCASFCAKEAFFKAISEPYNYTDCELFADLSVREQNLELSKELVAQYAIAEARVFLDRPNEEEILVSLFLLK